MKTKFAEDIFDKQMLDHLDVIKGTKGFHAQHKTMLLEYVYTHNKKEIK